MKMFKICCLLLGVAIVSGSSQAVLISWERAATAANFVLPVFEHFLGNRVPKIAVGVKVGLGGILMVEDGRNALLEFKKWRNEEENWGKFSLFCEGFTHVGFAFSRLFTIVRQAVPLIFKIVSKLS
ncbi:MAG: hypothetical protein LBS83_01005 [Holosporales bacterium]|jgi:hypothetical protein|nr:hypothetical protein [Holosporales bacterium]